jgi:hypothetical protein
MDPDEIQREIFSFDQKIALADLEVSKAQERVEELKYQKACFMVDIVNAKIKSRVNNLPKG